MIKLNYHMLLCLYIAASVFAQFYTTVPLHLFTLAGVAVWLPISAVTVVPAVDVLRSFTQAQAEVEGRHFKQVASTMLCLMFAVSGLCVLFLHLPMVVFVGVLAAVTIGGAVDILVFRRMGRYFTSPVARMAVSNLLATLTGSGLVFLVAFTDLVFPSNALARPYWDATVGWLTQSVVIWLSGLAIAYTFSRIKR